MELKVKAEQDKREKDEKARKEREAELLQIQKKLEDEQKELKKQDLQRQADEKLRLD